eukprot:Nk52_evm77s352 gene=Nk52_evmTU77s352
MGSPNRKVLIACDGSFHAENASAWYATHLAHSGDIVYLIHIVSGAKKNKEGQYTVTEEMKTKVEAIIATHKEIIRKSISNCGTSNVKGFRVRSNSMTQEASTADACGEISIEAHVLFGDAKQLLVNFVEENMCDMVVMGSRGLGTVKKTLMGSVSEYCMFHCQCPVIVVRETISAGAKKLVNHGAMSLP